MANNVPVTPGVGAIIATDDIGGGVEVQWVKLDAGAAGLSDQISSGQKTMAHSLPVTLASDQGAITVASHAVTNAGTFAVQATIADGASVTLGAKADAKSAATDTTAITIMQVLKQISASVQAPPSQAVTGTFFQATQPVSIASAAVVSGAFASGSIADGAQVTLGAKADARSTATDTTAVTAMQVLKQISFMAQAPAALPANQSTNVAQIAGTAASVNSGLKDAGTLRVVLATDQPALTNKLLVTPDSVALPANQSVNLNQAAGTALDVNSGTKSAGTIRVVLATDQPALTNKLLVTPDSVALPANQSVNVAQYAGGNAVTGTGAGGAGIPRVTVSNDSLVQAIGAAGTATTTVTRPADTTAYTAQDCWADSTSAPTAGGFTLSNMGRASGGSGIISDIMVISNTDPATLLQGELWIFDSAATATNDNAAFAQSDADSLLLVAIVPFTLATSQAGSGTNSQAHVQNLSIGYTCVGTANLRFKIKVKNAYTPASAETLTFRVKFIQTN